MAANQPPAGKAWKTLDEGLHANRIEHRQQTIVAMSTLPGTNEQAVKKLIDVMQHDGSVRVRQTAALALGTMKAQSAVPALTEALHDNPEVGFAAAKSLTDLGSPAGEDHMLAVLKGAGSAGPGMKTNMMRDARNNLIHPRNLVLMGAGGAGGIMFPPAGAGAAALSRTMDMRSHGGDGRAEAATYLGKHNNSASIKALQGALEDNNPAVRAEAAKSLADLGDASSIHLLVPLLDDSHTRVQSMAAASIIRLSQ